MRSIAGLILVLCISCGTEDSLMQVDQEPELSPPSDYSSVLVPARAFELVKVGELMPHADICSSGSRTFIFCQPDKAHFIIFDNCGNLEHGPVEDPVFNDMCKDGEV